jgi:hypothetical protein
MRVTLADNPVATATGSVPVWLKHCTVDKRCSGCFKNNEGESWRLPVAWKAIVKDSRVTLWQVFADTMIPFQIIERNS